MNFQTRKFQRLVKISRFQTKVPSFCKVNKLVLYWQKYFRFWIHDILLCLRRDRTSTASTNHKSNANLNSVIHTVSNQPRSLIELSDRKKVQSALFFGNVSFYWQNLTMTPNIFHLSIDSTAGFIANTGKNGIQK